MIITIYGNSTKGKLECKKRAFLRRVSTDRIVKEKKISLALNPLSIFFHFAPKLISALE
jgi:hypothetical protein